MRLRIVVGVFMVAGLVLPGMPAVDAVQVPEVPDAAAPEAAAPDAQVLTLPGAVLPRTTAVGPVAENGVSANYTPPAVVVPVDGSLTYTNLDLAPHNVVALESGPDDQPWCDQTFPPPFEGACPLFFSATETILGSTPVQGLENIEAGEAYPYYCTIHPWMRGLLVAAPEDGSGGTS